MKKPSAGGLILHKDNPFRQDLEHMLKSSKTANRTTEMVGPITRERVTLTIERDYLPFGFAKIYQNKELLEGLPPDACKILIELALALGYQQQKIELTPANTGVERRRFSRAMVELLGRRILVKEKPGWFWVNITLLVVGNIDKHGTPNPSQPGTGPDAGGQCNTDIS